MMAVLGEAFDAKHLTNTVTGAPRSLEFRVQVRLGLGFAEPYNPTTLTLTATQTLPQPYP